MKAQAVEMVVAEGASGTQKRLAEIKADISESVMQVEAAQAHIREGKVAFRAAMKRLAQARTNLGHFATVNVDFLEVKR